MVELSAKGKKIQLLLGVKVALIILAILVLIPLLTKHPKTQLDLIQKRGFINFLTLNSATSFYQDTTGANGFEYQLALLFADFIKVKARFITVAHFSDLYPELLFGTGEIAAASLSPLDSDLTQSVNFGPTYHQVDQQLLYRKGNVKRPRKITDLENVVIEVISGSSHAELLKELQLNQPDLSWHENEDIGAEELIELVDEGLIDYILADSHEISLQRRFFPELRVAFELGPQKQLRWAFNLSEDDSLKLAIKAFFTDVKQDGRLDQLIDRYFSHVAKFNYSDLQTFSTKVSDLLPKYQEKFQQEAKTNNLDWRLLAAIGYQESLWNAKAKSPTGVRGLMMLTQTTAKQMKVKNRLDPDQSIQGGAKYFARVLKKIPQRISQPDRNWFALASYNIGFGHLEDARKLTIFNNGDADKWIDVKKNLPLLSKKKWYTGTKYGYARGRESVTYVENIRKYYDLLVWRDNKNNGVSNDLSNQNPFSDSQLSPSL